MTESNNSTLLAMVEFLQKAGLGDSARLEHIKESILHNKTVYNSDKNYVEKKFTEYKGSINDTQLPESEHKPTYETTQDNRSFSTPKPDVRENYDHMQEPRSSAAWYLLPIFFWIIGGLISYVCLRKRHPSRARKTLGLGTGFFVLSIAILAIGISSNDYFTGSYNYTPQIELSDDEIKSKAITIPHDSLVKNSAEYTGEIVLYEGTIVQVKKQFGGNSYIIRLSIGGESSSEIIWLNYKPISDKEKEWLDKLERDVQLIVTHDPDRLITIWGESKGLKDYDTIFGGTVTIPEVNVWILERDENAESNTQNVNDDPNIEKNNSNLSLQNTIEDIAFVQENISQILKTDTVPVQAIDQKLYTVSYQNIPDYVDKQMVNSAIYDAINEWNENNSFNFEIVDSGEDLNIRWKKWMPGSTIGSYSVRNLSNGSTAHSIDIRLGNTDCHSDYQQYSLNSLQHTIAHEIGHYLGLLHINDKTHLMYSGEFFNVDSVKTFDDHDYDIPKIPRPEILSIQGELIQLEIDVMSEKIDQVGLERQEIKNMYDQGETLLLDNTERYNMLVLELESLKNQLECVER